MHYHYCCTEQVYRSAWKIRGAGRYDSVIVYYKCENSYCDDYVSKWKLFFIKYVSEICIRECELPCCAIINCSECNITYNKFKVKHCCICKILYDIKLKTHNCCR